MLKCPAIIPKQASSRIVSFADGTPAQLAAMLALHDAGEIDINDYWSVGDTRLITHSAMPATNVGETHAAQYRTWVIMDTGANSGYKFADDTPVHFVVGTQNSFLETGYMNSTNTNTGSWDSSARRAWCNNELRASLDAGTRALFKQFKTVTAAENNVDTLTASLDYFAMFAEKEVLGTSSYGRLAEANALTQLEWYKTTANRIKTVNGTASYYWERSPRSNNQLFCAISHAGAGYSSNASSANGLAQFGCI